GTWGALATGLFATVAVNPAGANGLFYGNPHQFLTQLIAVGVSWTYAFVATWIILKVLSRLMGLRLKASEEVAGLDVSQHGEEAYRL
ncbi:MAG: ammonia channel protein, partial [Chloroflexota bacterium]